MEVTCELGKERSREINQEEDERKNAFNQRIDLQSQNVSIGW